MNIHVNDNRPPEMMASDIKPYRYWALIILALGLLSWSLVIGVIVAIWRAVL